MGFKVLLADSDISFRDLLGRALLDAGYWLCPAESKEIALSQIATQSPQASILDIELPGGLGEVIEACFHAAMPVIIMGAAPRKETQYLVEILYYGIPYVKKFGNEGQARVEKVVARLNASLTTLLLYSGNKEYELGVVGGLGSMGYKVFVVNRASNLTRTFLTSQPTVVVAYYPQREDFDEIAKLRGLDARVPITVVLDQAQDGLREYARGAGATTILSKPELADYLLKLQTVSPALA